MQKTICRCIYNLIYCLFIILVCILSIYGNERSRAKRLQVQNRFIARSLVHNLKMKCALNVEIYTLEKGMNRFFKRPIYSFFLPFGICRSLQIQTNNFLVEKIEFLENCILKILLKILFNRMIQQSFNQN